jgi:Heterokaryon incompatibility protein (HET)
LKKLEAEQDAPINFQIPAVDEGFPMILGASDNDGGYTFNEVYTVSGSTKAPWLLIGEASERSRSIKEAVHVLRGWMGTCLTSHPACTAEQSPLPTRVLDVSNSNPQLYVSRGEKEPYTALSHCWGRIPLPQTHRLTLRDRLGGIPGDSLPKTFQDAISSTRELGIRYLWIDSLCIVQDDSDDWARESGRMASIYEGASVVLAASEAKDGHDGFLSTRQSSSPPSTILHGVSTKGESYSIRIREGDYHRWYSDVLPPRSRSLAESVPLSSRGWAFQKRLLATRYVQFRSHELVWECRSSVWCECGAVGRPSQQREQHSKKALYESLSSSQDLKLFSLWSRIVNAYAVKALTHGDDVLPALSGLAKQFKKAKAGTYLAGLWEADLPLCLLWEAHAAKASPYRAPSWSWASMDTSIAGGSLIMESTYDSKASAPTIVLATVESASCAPNTSDPTGQVANGFLTITGKVLDIITKEPETHEISTVQGRYDWDARIARQSRATDSKWIPLRVENFTFSFHADTVLSSPNELSCLLIGEIPTSRAPRALVLQKTPSGCDDVYERVGLIDRVIFGSSVRSNNWMFLFDHAPTRTVTII